MTFYDQLIVVLLMSLTTSTSLTTTSDQTISNMDYKTELLQNISDISRRNLGSLCISTYFQTVPVPVELDYFESTRQKVDMMAGLLRDLGRFDIRDILESIMKNLLKNDWLLEKSRILIYNRRNNGDLLPKWMAYVQRLPFYSSALQDLQLHTDYPINKTLNPSNSTKYFIKQKGNDMVLQELPWLTDPMLPVANDSRKFLPNDLKVRRFLGRWTYPYYWCETNQWLMTYAVPLSPMNSSVGRDAYGVLSVDVVLASFDVNQCDEMSEGSTQHQLIDQQTRQEMTYFLKTHKCDNVSSTCHFLPGEGWILGAYRCDCRPGYYSPSENGSLNGSIVENAFRDKLSFNSDTYDRYRCLPCAPGCGTCTNGLPCMASFDWTFGLILLSISMLWIVLTILLMGAVYKYRRLKVFKVASPIFLCITLLGCAIMYAEMAAIFPPLNTPSCIATKWTRHLGFCLTYSSLLMKTWRASLTYRVKSAHKIKLTDQQLLQWMFPILLVMLVYLAAWTASSPPNAEELETIGPLGPLKFTQCVYNWWDHSLAIGEVLFLIWGIRVCYSIRRAESYFNETKHISFAIYNIALVNTIMVSLHLYLLKYVHPDYKYLLGFIRTQLSTTVTIALIFGPKFYLVIRGQGDQHDNRARARGVTASFSLNGISVVDEDPPDLYRENEELKEELQKLAAQMEYMKIVHMGINNPHLKAKAGGYFNAGNLNFITNGPSVTGHQRVSLHPHTDLDSSKENRNSSRILHNPNPVIPSPAEEPLPNDSPTAELLAEQV